MEQFKETFLEEAGELLEQLETDLLALEKQPQNKETVSAVFRIMHTLKGSAGMFGFEAVAQFAHEIESVLESVRSGKTAVHAELITLTLAAGDHISALLASDQPESAALQAAGEKILASFRAYSSQYAFRSQTPQRQESSEERPASRALRHESRTLYKLYFKPAAKVFMNGTNPLLLLNELADLGQIKVVPRLEGLPPLSALNAEECMTAWDVELLSFYSLAEVQDVFIFLDNESEIAITAEKAPDEAEPQIAGSSSADAYLNPFHLDASLRISSDKLDKLVDLVGELVTFNARLSQLSHETGVNSLLALSEQSERLIMELRDTAMDMRMLPIGAAFNKFHRLARDLAAALGKEAEMEITGAETELDNAVLKKLNDPLLHLVRNALDHGIEAPDEREKTGKSRRGAIKLAAQHSGSFVNVIVSDDGAGLDKKKILEKALDKGLIAAGLDLSDQEIYELIFAAGFSTADNISDVSGRGVGMDVVKKEIADLGGSVSIQNSPGQGASFTLKIPLTLAIIEGLLARIGEESYVFPLASVEECQEFAVNPAEEALETACANLRGVLIPYVNLRAYFKAPSPSAQTGQLVVVNDRGSRIGFVVDQVIGDMQTVIKPLGRFYKNAEGISGATILGDGSVALILDVYKLSDMAAHESVRRQGLA